MARQTFQTTRTIILLRTKQSRLITKLWTAMNAKDNERLDNLKGQYIENRTTMQETKIPQEDIMEYDSRFLNLPWRACGYKTPALA